MNSSRWSSARWRLDEQEPVEDGGGRQWMINSPWRLEEVDGGDEQYPVESRFAVRHTPPNEQDPCFDRRRSVSSVLRYARPLPMNKIPFRMWPVEHKAVSSVLRYARPRFHRLFRTNPPDEHDDAFHSNPADWLPMNTTTTLFLRSDPAMYVCASRRSRPRPYVHICGRIFFLARWPLYVHVHATCAPLLRRARLYIDQYVRTHSRPE